MAYAAHHTPYHTACHTAYHRLTVVTFGGGARLTARPWMQLRASTTNTRGVNDDLHKMARLFLFFFFYFLLFLTFAYTTYRTCHVFAGVLLPSVSEPLAVDDQEGEGPSVQVQSAREGDGGPGNGDGGLAIGHEGGQGGGPMGQ